MKQAVIMKLRHKLVAYFSECLHGGETFLPDGIGQSTDDVSRKQRRRLLVDSFILSRGYTHMVLAVYNIHTYCVCFAVCRKNGDVRFSISATYREEVFSGSLFLCATFLRFSSCFLLSASRGALKQSYVLKAYAMCRLFSRQKPDSITIHDQ